MLESFQIVLKGKKKESFPNFTNIKQNHYVYLLLQKQSYENKLYWEK